jgi:putative Mn2+ efflux pump MntP
MLGMGFFLGETSTSFIENYDHWIAFVLLCSIGGNMIREGRTNEEEPKIGE